MILPSFWLLLLLLLFLNTNPIGCIGGNDPISMDSKFMLCETDQIIVVEMIQNSFKDPTSLFVCLFVLNCSWFMFAFRFVYWVCFFRGALYIFFLSMIVSSLVFADKFLVMSIQSTLFLTCFLNSLHLSLCMVHWSRNVFVELKHWKGLIIFSL